MDILKMICPHAFKAKDVMGLVIALVIYIIVCGICGAIIGWLAGIPIIGLIFSLLGAVLGIYGLLGIVLSILVFLKVVK